MPIYISIQAKTLTQMYRSSNNQNSQPNNYQLILQKIQINVKHLQTKPKKQNNSCNPLYTYDKLSLTPVLLPIQLSDNLPKLKVLANSSNCQSPITPLTYSISSHQAMV